MSDINEQIAFAEKEIRETPYHKGTEHYIGKLRARISRLRDKIYESSSKSSGGGGGYAVKKQGDATIVLAGPPSAGKSTLINKLTNAESRVAAYAFTTVSVVPGMFLYKDAFIQIMDIPGLIEGAKEGKGRSKEVLSVVRSSDLVIIMTDVDNIEKIDLIEKEFDKSGIRINKKTPLIKIEKKLSGGIIIHTNVRQNLSRQTIEEVIKEFRFINAEVTIKENLTLEKLIDALSPSRVYIPAIYCVNKVDLRKIEKNNKFLYISAEKGTGLEELKESIWNTLEFVRVYLIKPDKDPNYDDPIVMKKGQMLSEVTQKIIIDFSENKKSAKIWGPGAKFPGQEVSLSIPILEGMQARFI